MKTAAAFCAIFVSVFAARLCHSGVLWVEEAYPIAAALEVLRGKALYRDIWFDKPPLFPALRAVRGGHGLETAACRDAAGGVYLLVRVPAGAAVLDFAGRSVRGGLLAFFLTFGMAPAVMAVAPDLLMMAPHLLAIFFCLRGSRSGRGCAAGWRCW